MLVADLIVKCLYEAGITDVFAYPGGMIMHLYNAFWKYGGINIHSTYHEQSAAFAAEGYSRTSNNFGVALATSGPGATNLITGIGNAYFDSIPCVYITGQVNTYESNVNGNSRQIGFQETDIVSIVKPITKYCVKVTRKEDVIYELKKAINIAKNGRKGPVLLDIPMNIQREHLDEEVGEVPFEHITSDCDNIHEVIMMIKNSKRPVILAGGGIRLSGAVSEFREFVSTVNIPVVHSMMGKDALCDCERLNYGLIGAYGRRHGNFILANSDLIISLGSRLDSRQTGKLDSFAREAKLIRVDIDLGELKRNIKQDELKINSDVKKYLKRIREYDSELQNLSIENWLLYCENIAERLPNDCELNCANKLVKGISSILPNDAIITTDVGQNQIWVSQSFEVKEGQRVIVSGGMGAMGFSVPAAIGSTFAKDTAVFAFCGDGGFQMNIQELQFVFKEQLNLKIILMNNYSLGMIRHFQELYFNSEFIGTTKSGKYSVPDFKKLVEAYDISYASIRKVDEIDNIKSFLLSPGPGVLEIILDNETYALPKLSMGHPIEDQEPLLERNELKEKMLISVY